jgi:hypothetical protein
MTTFVVKESAMAAADPLTDYAEPNATYVAGHLDELADPALIEIDDTFLRPRLDNPTARDAWETWGAAYRVLQAAIDADAPHLRPLLDRLGDAGGDLGAKSETDGRDRGIALACAMRPSRTDPLDMTTWEAFQLFPLPGSVPDAAAISAAVINRLSAD